MTSKRISQLTAAGTLSGAELVELSKPSATVTITAATISAAAADNSFNDSANGFVAAGFAVGQAVRVTGFTGNTANNIYSAVVTAVTAGKLTIGGADGDVIVDDAAGESVTITAWESARSTAQDVADEGLETWAFSCSDYKTTALAAATDIGGMFAPYAATVVAVSASLHTAQTSGALVTVDVNEAGATILSTKLTFDNGQNTTPTAATPAVVSDASIAAGAKLSADCDAIGDGTAKGLTVYLRVRPS